jgi:hypothetical protein
MLEGHPARWKPKPQVRQKNRLRCSGTTFGKEDRENRIQCFLDLARIQTENLGRNNSTPESPLHCSGYCSDYPLRRASIEGERRIVSSCNGACFQPDVTLCHSVLRAGIRIKSQLLCQLSYAPFSGELVLPGSSRRFSAGYRQIRLMPQLGKLLLQIAKPSSRLKLPL